MYHNQIDPESCLTKGQVEQMSFQELEIVNLILISALADILEITDVKEEDIENQLAEIEEMEEQGGSKNSDNADLLNQLERALQIKENKLIVQNEIDKRKQQISPIQTPKPFLTPNPNIQTCQNEQITERSRYQSTENNSLIQMIPIVQSETQKVENNNVISDQSESDETKLSSLKLEYEAFMRGEEISSIELFDEIIIEKMQNLEKAKIRKRQKEISEAQSSLERYLNMRDIYDEIKKLDAEKNLRYTQNEIKRIETLLDEGRDDLEIIDISEGYLERKNEELKRIYEHQVMKKNPKAELTKKKIGQIEVLKEYETQLEKLKNQIQEQGDKPKSYNDKEAINSQIEDEVRQKKESYYEEEKQSDLIGKLAEYNVNWSELNQGKADIQIDKSMAQAILQQEDSMNRVQQMAADRKKQEQLTSALIFAREVQNRQDCFEKTVCNLYYYTCLQKYKQQDVLYRQTDLKASFENLIDKLKQQVVDEQIQDPSIKSGVQIVGANDNLELVSDILNQILRKIIVFSFQELFGYEMENYKLRTKINRKNIILLIGPVGVGKSSFAHYLAGTEFKLQKVKGLNYYEPVKIKNSELEQVPISKNNLSATSHLAAIQLNDNGMELLLVDSPGLQEVQRAEIDYAHYQGLQTVISQQAQSVRIVLFFSYRQIGQDMENLRKQILIYCKHLNNLTENIKDFSYVFTHAIHQGETLKLLQKVKGSLNQQDKEDYNLGLILDDIIRKAQSKYIIELNPLDERKRDDILNSILEMRAYSNPSFLIASELCETSLKCIQHQLELHKQQIISSLANERLDIINTKLDEISQLIKFYPNEQQFQTSYNECIQSIIDFINQSYQIATDQMRTHIDIRGDLTKENIKNYYNQFIKMTHFDEIITKKSLDVHFSERYLKFLSDILTLKQNNLVQSETKINDPVWFDFLLKVQMLSVQFKHLEQSSLTAMTTYKQKVEQLKVQCYSQMEERSEFNFIQDEFYQMIAEIVKAQEQMSKINKNYSEEFARDFQDIAIRLESFISKTIESYFTPFINSKIRLTEQNIDQIKNVLEFLKKLKTGFLDQNVTHFDKLLTESLLSLQDQLKKLMNMHLDKLIILIRQDKPSLPENHDINVFLLMRLFVPQDIDLKMFEFKSSVESQLKKMFENVELILMKEKEVKNNNYFLKLTRGLDAIKTLEWVNQFQQESTFYQKTILQIGQLGKDIVQKVWRQFAGMKIQISDHYKLEKLLVAYQQVQEYSQKLAILGINLAEDKIFQDCLDQIIELIQTTEGIIASFESQKNPLDIQELQLLFNIHNFFQIISENENVFRLPLNIATLATRITESGTSLFQRQYFTIIDLMKTFASFIQEQCSGQNQQSIQNNDIQQYLDRIQNLLNQINVLKMQHQRIYSLLDSKNNLQTIIEEHRNQILMFFRCQQVKFEKTNPAMFKHCYNILKQVTFIDDFFANKIFSQECENWKQKLLENPTAIIDKCKILLLEKNYIGIKEVINQIIFSIHSAEDFENIKFLIKEEVEKRLLSVAQFKLADDKQKGEILKIIEDAKTAKEIMSTVYFQLCLNVDVDSQLNNFISRLISQAEQLLQKSKQIRQYKKYAISCKYIKVAKEVVQSLIEEEFEEKDYIELNQKIQKEESEMIVNIADEIEAYKKMDLSQAIDLSPKQFDEDIKNLSNFYDFKAYSDQLENNVLYNLREKIASIREHTLNQNSSVFEINNLIANFEEIQESIPALWWGKLNQEIKTVKKQLQIKQDNENKLIEKIQSIKSIENLIQLLQLNNKLKDDNHFLEQIKKCISEQLNECKFKITQTDQLGEGIKQIIEIENSINNTIVNNCLEKFQNDEFNKLGQSIIEIITKITDEIIVLFQEQSPYANILHKQINFNENFKKLSSIHKGIENVKYIAKKDSILQKFILIFESKKDIINDASSNYLKNLKVKVNQHLNEATFDIKVDYQKILLEVIRIDNIIQTVRFEKFTRQISLGFDEGFHQDNKFLINEQNQKIEKMMTTIETIFDKLELITSQTNRSEFERAKLYKLIEKLLKFFEVFEGFENDFNAYIPIEKLKDLKNYCQKQLGSKIEKFIYQIKDLSNEIIDKPNQQITQFNEFYQHICSMEQNLSFESIKMCQAIQFVSSQIQQQIILVKNQAQSKVSDLVSFCEDLCRLQRVGENIPQYRDFVKHNISSLIKLYKENKKGSHQMNFLANTLKKFQPEGCNLINEHTDFQGVERALWNQKVQRFGIEDVLINLGGTNLNKEQLGTYYSRFKQLYEKTVQESLQKQVETTKADNGLIIQAILKITDQNQGQWTQQQAERLPELLAYIFALWTLKSTEHYFEADQGDQQRDMYLKQPHAAQIISIFRIMGVGYTSRADNQLPQKKSQSNNFITDNLVQIKTGEGKSITLAAVSIVFALYGYEVRTACYSEYLSSRDYDAFKDLFISLGILDRINYGTFNQACEDYINQDGDIREIYLSYLLKGSPSVKKVISVERPRILMIDEVDVFFSKNFYGAQFRPAAIINHPSIAQLIDYIWDNRNNRRVLQTSQIIKSEEYKLCQELFNPTYLPLLEEAVKSMICDVEDFHLHDYIEVNGMIGYKDQDQISFNISYGYKTTFAYYQNYAEGKIDLETLEQQKSLSFNCGEFSYAEIPTKYTHILGVTGTLEQLTASEKKIIKDVYGILNFTFCPSVYGDSNLKWDPQENIIIAKLDRYYLEILTEIRRKLKENTRSVIVFFNNDKNLTAFIESKIFKESIFQPYQVLNEVLNQQEKTDKIKKASYPGNITFATRSFGRGADFICNDTKVEEAGGVHVLLTFFSLEMSEEVQLLGRTARQGNQGSISMILLLDDLSSFNIYDKDLKEYGKSKYYEMLNKKRSILQERNQEDESQALEDKAKKHEQATMMAKRAFEIQGDDKHAEEIFKYLKEINLGRVKAKTTKTLILMDATGSMSSLINKTKNAVSAMFLDAYNILSSKNIDPKLVEIQFGCYRNYSSKKDLLLQFSSWESDHQILTKFMETITASGGQGREAVEIGLWHANREADFGDGCGLSQAFIIGDMPPNTLEEVEKNRQDSGEAWEQTPYAEKTHYKQEVHQLKQKGIQVFTFYIRDEAKVAFEEIAKDTGAKCQFLDVNSPLGQKTLVELFVTQILQKVGDENGGKGNELVQAYKTYISSSQ